MNFLGMGPMELLLIVVLALIVFGPARLPEIMGQVGKAIGDFRRATSELSDEFNRTIQAELQETRAVVEETKATLIDAKASVYDAHAQVNSAITGTPAPVRTAVPGDALAAANGTSAEPYVDGGANGTAPAEPAPALADTTQWSWETSASPAPATPSTEAAETPSAERPAEPDASAAASPAVAEGPESVSPAPAEATPDATNPVPPAPSPSKERAARDELSPPY
jgi:sec-independent protein translocase protein TatB